MIERQRSVWGWGWADRFPSDERRAELAAQLGALLGVELTPGAPAEPRLPPPRVTIPESLASIASAEPGERARHTYGRSYRDLQRGFAGDFSTAPDFVLQPYDENDVARALAWGEAEKVAVIPFGGGTSVVGGVEAELPAKWRGAVSLDLRRLDRVLEVDALSRAARIQAGATGPVLERQLAEHGLTLRHFPQSFEFSTLGGWIVTRAGGHFATLYTHIDDLVESIRMITPRGVWQGRRLPASGAGPSPERLVLGSEGILGVVVEAWMRVFPRPKWRSSASVLFAKFEDGVAAARAIAQDGLYPANCRLLDAREALLHGVMGDGSSVLLLAFESAEAPKTAWMARALELAAAHGGACPSGAKERSGAGESWKAAFLEAPYLQSALVSLGVVADTFETACTWDRFAELHEAIGRAVREAGGASTQLACRFTHVYPDGPAPYYTFLAAPGEGGGRPSGTGSPSAQGSPALATWERIKRAAGDAILAHGGTITHHHSVGRMHRPWYDRERPEPFARALRAAKSALDPEGILNPGVLIDL